MSKTANSSWETTGKPIVVLTVISLIVSLLLALVNGMTAPVIKENTRRTTLASGWTLLPRPRASAPMCPPMIFWHSSTAWTAPRTL